MPAWARRLPARGGRRPARRVLLALCLWLAGLGPALSADPKIAAAAYGNPTTIYGHGILGDAIEYFDLHLTLQDGKQITARLQGGNRVFEDIAPRLWDVTGDGHPEVVVIETEINLGAQLAVYGFGPGGFGKIAQTPHIGQTHRWLAPIGAADLDGDGHIEIAYIDRPHLAKTLRIWRYRNGQLEHVADADGLTNHRIGQDFISGGMRDCGQGPEMITVDAGWNRVMASTFANGQVKSRKIGAFRRQKDLKSALNCKR